MSNKVQSSNCAKPMLKAATCCGYVLMYVMVDRGLRQSTLEQSCMWDFINKYVSDIAIRASQTSQTMQKATRESDVHCLYDLMPTFACLLSTSLQLVQGTKI